MFIFIYSYKYYKRCAKEDKCSLLRLLKRWESLKVVLQGILIKVMFRYNYNITCPLHNIEMKRKKLVHKSATHIDDGSTAVF